MERVHASDNRSHRRKALRLRGYDYSQPGAYFVTACANDRECLFGEIVGGEVALNAYGQAVDETWKWLATQYPQVSLDAWVVMPNHVHGIIVLDGCRGGSRAAPTPTIPASDAPAPSALKPKPLGSLIGAFKTVSAKRINGLRNAPGAAVWQRGFYEHVIRGERDLLGIREYIAGNPARWAEDEENPARTATRKT